MALGASLEGDSDFMAVTDAAMRAKERAIAAHNDMVESNRAARDAAARLPQAESNLESCKEERMRLEAQVQKNVPEEGMGAAWCRVIAAADMFAVLSAPRNATDSRSRLTCRSQRGYGRRSMHGSRHRRQCRRQSLSARCVRDVRTRSQRVELECGACYVRWSL